MVRLDHVVVRVNGLEDALRDYQALGFSVVRGGEHPGLGSRNALIAFADDTYVELIAFERQTGRDIGMKLRSQRAAELEAAGRPPMECRHLAWESSAPGFVDFALVPDDIEGVLQQARQAGLTMHGPFAGGRLRPDGQRVAWNLGVPDGFDLPFLCADVTARELRLPQGDARRHANGARGIHCVCVNIERPDSVDRYRKLLGSEPVSFTSPGGGKASDFRLGCTLLRLGERSSPDRQDGPYCLWLDSEGSPQVTLDRSMAHGAIITLSGPSR